ncbi:MAG: hypothetical protein IKW23_05395, partial [Kiritimatiellae bacterium]|nr:hypothetical protein [Kiritimatiellia bacterium]
MGGSAAALPEGCFAVFRELRDLAKDAYRGRHGTACPAMPPLRFAGAHAAPAPRGGRATPKVACGESLP